MNPLLILVASVGCDLSDLFKEPCRRGPQRPAIERTIDEPQTQRAAFKTLSEANPHHRSGGLHDVQKVAAAVFVVLMAVCYWALVRE